MNRHDDVYPSRYQATASILERQDPVIYSDQDADADLPIHAGLLQAYADQGYLSLEGFFSEDELAPYQEELHRLRTQKDITTLPEVVFEPGSADVRSIFYIHRTNEVLRGLLYDQRLLAIVKYLLGGEVYIHQSRINYKPGFTGQAFDWHSDFETWHVEDGMPRMRALSCSISLSENNEFNGPLMVIPGSHQWYISCIGQTPEDHYKTSLQKQEYGVPDHNSIRHLVDRGGIVAPKGPAGSVTVFDCNLMHGSGPNLTPWARNNIFCVYNSVENMLIQPFGNRDARPEFIAARQDVAPLEPV
ncbi:MAG: multidrug DMT transporter permease [Candidatus Entotheonella factor]|uniref:Ectoine hydroxylase n=1 Tax=Entotheonella factor TaxID=1429438 RepID=W4L9J4_ENTF1|nr:ectoine hydroxylase [Candidatus Entotheonella palauensis]ETW94763.1 MAG: multidrug DMT transporter permease [Candidatus Entotheonella factor]